MIAGGRWPVIDLEEPGSVRPGCPLDEDLGHLGGGLRLATAFRWVIVFLGILSASAGLALLLALLG